MIDELHSFISDVLHRRGLVDRDGFAMRSAKALMTLEAWDDQHIKTAINRVRTDLYRRHPSWPRDKLLGLVASRVMGRWKEQPSNEQEGAS